MITELAEYTKICKLTDLNEKIGKRFVVDEVDIAVFKIDGKVYALSNVCPHQHSAMIYDGFIEDGCVICPLHGWEFNIKNGRMKTGSTGLDSFSVEIKDGEVYVKVWKKELKW